ncbi:chitin synthase [Alternaria panax]|uniref:chitin synthase n=1 Tax=Alternaria panax TaxID=48097 RepID=A0AAD4FD46_9PLEO|nr:chitin synthase [Alternaria panax]
MEILDAASSGVQIAGDIKNTPNNLRKRSFSFSSRTLSSAIEHLPTVDARRLKIEKYVVLSLLIPLNCILMYMFTDWSRFFWYLSPKLMLRSIVDFIEITLVIIFFVIRRLYNRQPKIPEKPENFVYLLCCYNESYPELMTSLNSLAEQQLLDTHKKAIIVVCDGRVSSKGEPKTAAAYLKEDIIEHSSSTFMTQAYTAWDGAPMDVEIIKGEFRGIPIVCVIKDENRGKRDGIVLIRSFMHKFNQRHSHLSLAMLSPELFAVLTKFLEEASIQFVDYAVGIDADTRFDVQCVFNLMQTVREDDDCQGATGYIRPDPKVLGSFSISYLYQSAEYLVGQHRRRLRQSLTSRKVTCLPGCCQLLRVTEYTCGDHILGKFGYYPRNTDGLFRTIRSMMSEDRDHVCLVLSEYAHVRTRVCLSARAYTTAPTTPSVFLSQRRRWTLGPLTSDSLLVSRRTTGWIERVAAFASILHWVVNPTLYLSRFYRRLDNQTKFYLFLLENYRLMYDMLVIVAASDSVLDAIQSFVGALMYGLFAPTVNFVTQLYTLYKLDDFRWGKTRIGVTDKAK